MKTKELKNLAKKIANAELVVQTSEDPQAVRKAQNQIMELSKLERQKEKSSLGGENKPRGHILC